MHAHKFRNRDCYRFSYRKKMKQPNVILCYLKLQDDPVLKSLNPIPYAISISVSQPRDVNCFSQEADQSRTGVPDAKPQRRRRSPSWQGCLMVQDQWASSAPLLLKTLKIMVISTDKCLDKQDSTQDRNILCQPEKEKQTLK